MKSLLMVFEIVKSNLLRRAVGLICLIFLSLGILLPSVLAEVKTQENSES